MAADSRSSVLVDGHLVSYLQVGPERGRPVVLVHGLASDGDTWDRAIGPLAAHGLRVVALDLLGHGRSDKPSGGYLLDDFARQLRGFFDALGLESATVCGHSLGGAVAMHFAHYFPRRVQRLVLVAAGGLGSQVHPMLRAATLPVAARAVALAMDERLMPLYGSPALHRALRLTPDKVVNISRIGRALRDPAGRDAFFGALRGVITGSGQFGSFLREQRVAPDVPTLLVWAERDVVIPVAHAYAARRQLPRSRLLVFPGGGHEPHRRHAAAFADAVADFVATTPAYRPPAADDPDPADAIGGGCGI